MEQWRIKGAEFLPEAKPLFALAGSPDIAWNVLYNMFMDGVSEGDEGLQRRILDYAAWCTNDQTKRSATEVYSAVYHGFMHDVLCDGRNTQFFTKWLTVEQYERYRRILWHEWSSEALERFERDFFSRANTPRATIYIPLADEGTPVWRPVTAERVTYDIYRILSTNSDPEAEQWPFNYHDEVRCHKKEFEGGVTALVAVEKASSQRRKPPHTPL